LNPLRLPFLMAQTGRYCLQHQSDPMLRSILSVRSGHRMALKDQMGR
jgi:hypothetical protein